MKVFLGILLGIGITFALFWGYREVVNPYYKVSIPQFVVDSSKKVASEGDIIVLKSQGLKIEERIESANKRLDDMLIFGGIIITLLLAINVTVYVNSERQVEKYFRDNFEIHKQKVTKYLSDVEEMAGKIKTELELIQNIKKQGQSVQTPPQ